MTAELSVPAILTPCLSSLDEVCKFVDDHAGFVAENEISILQVEYSDAYEKFYKLRSGDANIDSFTYRNGFALGFFVGRKHAQQTGQKLKITPDVIEKFDDVLWEYDDDLRQQIKAVNLRMVKKEKRYGILELSDSYYHYLEYLLEGTDLCLIRDDFDKAFAESYLLVMTSLEAESVRRQYFPTIIERIKDKILG